MGDKKKKLSFSVTGRKGYSLEGALFRAMITLVIIVLVMAGVLYLQITTRVGEVYTGNARQVVNSLTGQLQSMVRHYSRTVDQVAAAPELANLLSGGDRAALQRKEQELKNLFPGALRVRIFDARPIALDNSVSPPISYACQDMLERVIKGQPLPPVEIHQPGSQHQHIDIVRRIVDSDRQIIGRVLVTLSVKSLRSVLSSAALDRGYAEVRQGKVVIATLGRRKLNGPAAISSQIAGTRWSVMLWMDKAAVSFGATSHLIFWGVFGVGVLLLALVCYLLYRKVTIAMRNDQVSIIRLFKDLQDGDVQSEYPCQLKNNHGTIRQLQKMAHEMEMHPGASSGSGKANYSDVAHEEIGPAAADALQVTEVGNAHVAPEIFRAYDIRGVVGETLDEDIVYQIGRALGSEAYERGQQQIVVARDGRLSGPALSRALVRGLKEAGREVIDIGEVPTPVLYFATHYLGTGSGVMLTGSHNPANYNGLKMMLRGETLHGDSIRALYDRISNGRLVSGDGSVQTLDIAPSYIERITGDVNLMRPLKVIVDCGNGVAGGLAPKLLKALGCEVTEMFCEVDGNFPNHHPDPSKPENMTALTRSVLEQKADIGIAFDGDGDRIGVVDSRGKIIWPDRLLMLLATDVLARNKGAQIIYDVKCSRSLEKVISDNGGEPLMWKTGHSFIKAKMQETGALLAGEMSGHIFYKDRWYGFDDGLYTCARLLEILSALSKESSRIFAMFPESVSTPELNILMKEGEHFRLMEKLKSNAEFPGARIITIDGLRVEFDDGWGLIRASNTTPSLVLRFEADEASSLRRIQDEFRKLLLEQDPNLELPF